MTPDSKRSYTNLLRKLVFRPVTWEHLEYIHDLHSRPEVDEHNTLGIPKDLKETKDFLATIISEWNMDEQSVYEWSVFIKDSDEFIGIAGMRSAKNRFMRGEIFYNILPEQWGQGYGTEIGNWLLRFGFEDLNLHRIEAGVAIDNTRSIALLEKLGMTREGIRRKILPIRGEWRDNYHYSILEEEYFAKRSAQRQG